MGGRLVRRLRYWLNSGERSRLLREEMESHLEMKVQDMVDSGMPENEARAEARRQFGNLTRQQEQSRGTWIAQWISDAMQDAVFAGRTIAQQRGFTAAATLSAALGIGACSMLFGLANHALFRPLPVEDPSRLVSLSGKNLRSGKAGISLTYPDSQDLRQARSFDALTVFFGFMPGSIATNGEAQRYWGSLVSANYFDVVRPAFAAGRGFDPDKDDRTGERPVVVLSHRLWQSRFGSDAGLIGRDIQLNGRKVTVVGVTGPRFRGTESMFYSDFWVPFSMLDNLQQAGLGGDRMNDRHSQWLQGVARLRDGVSETAAAAEIAAKGKQLSLEYPATNKDREFHIERAGLIHPGFRKAIFVFFAMLMGVAVLVLCTACANIANLLLARASARRKEIATRLALGASRSRLVRQLLTESILLALLGGVGGYLIAHLGATSIGRMRLPISMPVDLTIALDYRVMLFCIGLSALTGVLFGLVPAIRATRQQLTGALKDDRASFGGSRRFGLRNALVVTQVTICMVLLICSGLFLRSLHSAAKTDPGFEHRNLLMMAFDPSLNGYKPEATRRLVETVVERTRGIAGVQSVSLTNGVPLNLEGTQNAFTPGGEGSNDDTRKILADIYAVSPGFFDTFGIRVIAGEDFRAGQEAEDIAIVNQALADRAFDRRNPVGQQIFYQGRVVRITGMVATAKSRTIGEEPRPCLYFPIMRELRGNDSLTGMTLVLRTSGNPAAFVAAARQAIREVDPSLAVFDVRTMETQLSQALFAPRAAALLLGLAGMMGVLIATVGIYGVISFTVARQTKEIGVRVALGAKRAHVIGMVLKQGALLTVTGAAIGLGAALALSRTAAGFLYGISPTDTLTFIAVPSLLLAISLAACLIPARRAASLDPNQALRYE